MRLTTQRLIPILAVGLIAAAQAQAQVRPRPQLDDRDYLPGVQEAARHLAHEVERLQGDIVAELRGQAERDLYRRADAVLAEIHHFRTALKTGYNRQHLYRDFEQMDGKLHQLMKDVRALGEKHHGLHRTVNRVHQADQQLHYALSHGDDSPDRGKQVVSRQAHALAVEANALHETAKYALADDKRGHQIEEGIRQLNEAALHFHRGVEKGVDRDHARRDFAAVDRAWRRVVNDMKALTPRENRYLYSRAEAVDAAHDRLYRILGMEGARIRLLAQGN